MEYLIKSSALIAIFYLFYKLLLNKETYFTAIRWFLIIGLLMALCLPSLEFIRYVEVTELASTAIGTTTNDLNLVASVNTTASTIDWHTLVGYIYVAGVLILSAQFLMRLISLLVLLAAFPFKKLGNFYMVETNKEMSPFSFFNCIVYNPKQFSTDELEQILKHEKAHARQLHSIDTLVIQLMAILQWFNPFVWLYKNEMEQNLEFMADDITQRQVENKNNYQQLLLKTSVPNYQLALANNFYNSILKKRIFMLRKERSTRKSQWKLALIIPLIAAFVLLFNTRVVAQSDSDPEIVEVRENIMELLVSKKATKEDLNKIKDEFSEAGLKLSFSGIKRNSDGHITAIKIDAKASNGKAAASYASDDDEPIKTIRIAYDSENNSLSLGSNSNSENVFRFRTGGDHNVFIKKSGSGSTEDVIHIDTDDEDGSSVHVWTSKDGKHKKVRRSKEVIVEIDDDGNESKKEVYKIRRSKGGEEDVIQFIEEVDDKDTKTVIIVNGKKVTKEQLKKMDKKDIKTIEIKKERKKKKN